LKAQAKSIKDHAQLSSMMKDYFTELRGLEQVIEPIMERVHKEAGLVWKGRKETAGLIQDKQTPAPVSSAIA